MKERAPHPAAATRGVGRRRARRLRRAAPRRCHAGAAPLQGRPEGAQRPRDPRRAPVLMQAYHTFNGHILYTNTLDARQRELLVLRVAARRGAEYEWRQHVVIARDLGFTDADIERIAEGPHADGWSAIDAAMLRAVDELVADAEITDDTWAGRLAGELDRHAAHGPRVHRRWPTTCWRWRSSRSGSRSTPIWLRADVTTSEVPTEPPDVDAAPATRRELAVACARTGARGVPRTGWSSSSTRRARLMNTNATDFTVQGGRRALRPVAAHLLTSTSRASTSSCSRCSRSRSRARRRSSRSWSPNATTRSSAFTRSAWSTTACAARARR